MQRKSWVIPSTSDDFSPKRNNLNSLPRLSSDSLNIHSNCSTNYQNDDVEYDTSEYSLPNDEQSVDISTATLFANNSINENPSKSINNQDDDNHSQLKNIEINNLPDSELEPSSSRRDTYSIEKEQIVTEQSTTPAPKRSILKCSKTTKTIRSRSSCRMVQFARLPKSDSKIKMSKNRFNSGFNVVTDKINETDVFQNSKEVMQIDGEEYDDDLDGVQPLDNSISSLFNSPILDNCSTNKSSKRGSRGNKVMSLINSFEKRTIDSSKHSIRASDLLSMSGSKHGDSLLSTSDFENNTTMVQESVSSSRRINLENIFVAEDSLKDTCNLDNETVVTEIDKSLIHSVETTLNSKQDLNNTDTANVLDNLSENCFERENNLTLPFNIQSQQSSTITVTSPNHSTLVDTEENQVDNEVTNSSLNHKLINISNISNVNDHFEQLEAAIEEEKCVDNVENLEMIEIDHTQKPNNILQLFEQSSDKELPSISVIADCMAEMFNISKDDLEITNSQHQDNLTESYVIIDKHDQNKSNLSKDINNSDQLDKSINITNDSSTIEDKPKICETHSPKKIVEVLNVSSDSCSNEMEDNENKNKVHTNLECTISTSIGKPQYESTPWNSSTSSKTTFITTSSVQPNETRNSNVSENKHKKNSVTLVNELEVWSQMMKDFNESVRKASISNNNVNVTTVSKVLFREEPESCKITSQVVPKDVLSSNIVIEKNTSDIEKNNTLQCSTVSSCSPNNTLKLVNANDPGRWSSRSNSNKSVLKTKSSTVLKSNPNNVKEINNTSKSSVRDKMSLRKNNSIDSNSDVNKSNEKSQTKTFLSNNKNLNGTKKRMLVIPQELTNVTSDTDSYVVTTSTNERDINTASVSTSSYVSNKYETIKKKKSVSPNVYIRRNLRARVKKNLTPNNSTQKLTRKRAITSNQTSTVDDSKDSSRSTRKLLTSIRELKRTSKNIKKQTPTKPQKNVSFVENNFVTIKPVVEKSEKITLSLNVRSTRSNSTLTESSILKLDKKNKTISPIKTKSIQVKKAVQTKKLTKKAQSKRVLRSKPIKKNTRDSSEDNKSTSESTPNICVPSKIKKNKLMKKENNIQIENKSISLRKKSTQKEKVCENSSVSLYPITRSRKRIADTSITQPIAKVPKSDISSEIVANDPQKNSSRIKRNRNMSKLTTKVSDNSFSEIENISKIEKPKSTKKTNGRKRILKSEVSSNDSEQSAKKKTRSVTEENKKTEMKINSFTHSASKDMIISTNSKEKLNK